MYPKGSWHVNAMSHVKHPEFRVFAWSLGLGYVLCVFVLFICLCSLKPHGMPRLRCSTVEDEATVVHIGRAKPKEPRSQTIEFFGLARESGVCT